MNKTILSLVCLLVLFAGTAMASICPDCTVVAGIVTIQGTITAVENATVHVDCNGATNDTMTDSTGFYASIFKSIECNATDTATVTATKSGVGSGSNTGMVNDLIWIDLAVVNVQIPEFGLVTGAMVIGIAGLGVVFLRKKA